MTNDGFVFDDSDDDEYDETELFGTRSDESPDVVADDRRFGTSTADDTDSSLVDRVPDAVSGDTIRTVAVVALAVVIVTAGGLVAYPLVMGAFDTADSPEGTTERSDGFTDSTHSSLTTPATGTIVEESAGPTAVTTVETTPPPTTVATAPTARPSSSMPTATPTQTATPTSTPLPTRGFPAGTPVETNETNESA